MGNRKSKTITPATRNIIPETRNDLKLQRRFAILDDQRYGNVLPLDCWMIVQRFIPRTKQIVFTYVCRDWYNLYWDTRTGWQFDPDNAKDFFERINDGWLEILLEKCHKKYFVWMSLNFCHKNLTQNGFAQIYNMEKLTSLNLSNNFYLTNSALSHISKLTELEILNISGCLMIQRSGMAHISSLTKLRKLNLSGITGLIDVNEIYHLTNLENLNLYDCEKLEMLVEKKLRTFRKIEKPKFGQK